MADPHSTKVGATHGTISASDIIGGLVVLQSSFGIEAQIKLILPPKFITSLAQSIISHHSPRVLLGYIGCMGRQLESYDSIANIILIRKSEMLLRRHIT